MSETEQTRVDYAALAELRFAIRKFLAFSEAAAARADLTPQQHQALLTVKGFGADAGLSVGGLAERLLVRQHTAVELVDRLEQANLVGRSADPSDGRRVLVKLTPEGERRLAALSSVHLDELHVIGPALVAIIAGLGAEA
jgi:DNA-binding MarR family transcriptional regulator